MTTIEDWFQKEWPVKPHEGSIGITFSDSDGKYIATIKYFIFNKYGRGAPKTDWADGGTPDEAFSQLWTKAVLTIIELKELGELPMPLADWARRFLGVEDIMAQSEDIKTCTVGEGVGKGDRAQAFTEKGDTLPIMFIAPIDLEPSDLCIVDITDGHLFQIYRRLEIIWSDILYGP